MVRKAPAEAGSSSRNLDFILWGVVTLLTMPKDYKDSLNLPLTAFPMKANLAQREPEILKSWE
ncbi:MAG TPA: hypothetical protein VEI46_02925, partial [Thermodesulfovibrionales bacterium]|nr:hypothetical protein [Thermodesulfovibrionales bacterium]